MKRFALLLVLIGMVCGAAYGQVDEANLSPEGKALKAKYDAAIQKLQADFMEELGALSDRLDAVESAPPPAAKRAWYDNLMINGYFQADARARDYDNAIGTAGSANERDDFGIRRFYVNLIADFNKVTKAVVTLAGAGPNFRDGPNLTSTADWANVFVDFKPAPAWSVRMGQAPTQFGLDLLESSSIRYTPERALVCEGNGNIGYTGLYFAGPWDRGLWVTYDARVFDPDKEGIRIVGSVHNGQFRNTDADNHKNVSLDAEYFTQWGQFGVSWLDGKFAGEDRDAFGINVRIAPDNLVENWGFQAEYIDGRWISAPGATVATDLDGWYAQASYHFDGHPGIAYLRYEEFDPDNATVNDEYDAIHLGYKYRVTPVDEITVEYTDGSAGPDSADEAILQYQRKF